MTPTDPNERAVGPHGRTMAQALEVLTDAANRAALHGLTGVAANIEEAVADVRALSHAAAVEGDASRIEVSPTGVTFGPRCWISHEKITGCTADELSERRGVLARLYMEWVQARLTTPPAPAAVAGGEWQGHAKNIALLKAGYHVDFEPRMEALDAAMTALAAQPAVGEEWPRELVEWLETRNLLPGGPFDGNDLVAVLNDHEAALAAAQRPGAGDQVTASIQERFPSRRRPAVGKWAVLPPEICPLALWLQPRSGLMRCGEHCWEIEIRYGLQDPRHDR